MSDSTEIERESAKTPACAPPSQGASCWGPGCLSSVRSDTDPITRDLYDQNQVEGLPGEAVHASLGCGNPTALATLNPGEIVLDLGSGGGIDVLLSARRVGRTGKVYGLDTTEEALELARRNQRKVGLGNVEFLKGEIERIPLPDNSVDVIISNCVINLSADKDQALAEAFRVLKPGGRFAVSDVVSHGAVTADIRRVVAGWLGGVLDESDYLARLHRAGFERASIEPTRVYAGDDARRLLTGTGPDVEAIWPLVDGRFFGGFVRAQKPATAS